MELLAYHGTNLDFKEFNILKGFGSYSALAFGIYFTLKEKRAISYSRGGRVIAAKISFNNLFDCDELKMIKVNNKVLQHCDLIPYLKKTGLTPFGINCFLKNIGFDGLKSNSTLVVFSKKQIKEI